MSDLHLEVSEIWHLLDNAPSPAPSHRNRTVTRWGEVMETAKRRLAGIGKRVKALEDDLALLQARLVDAQAQIALLAPGAGGAAVTADLNMVAGTSALWAGVCSPSLIDIEISDKVTGEMTSFTLGTIEAVSLADWLNAWIKTQQWQPEDYTDAEPEVQP